MTDYRVLPCTPEGYYTTLRHLTGAANTSPSKVCCFSGCPELQVVLRVRSRNLGVLLQVSPKDSEIFDATLLGACGPFVMLPARALSRFFELSPAAPRASPSLGWSASLISKPQAADDSAKEHVLWRSLSISVWN